MNLKNMKKLRAHLRSRKNLVKFEMADWFTHNGRDLRNPHTICRTVEEHPCGTAACLAGLAALLAFQSGDVSKRRTGDHIRDVAAKWLGLDWNDSHNLFVGNWSDRDYGLNMSDLTKAQAIAELTRLIDAETL